MSEIVENMSEVKIQENNHEKDIDEDIVDPWNVVSKSETGIDYEKLISKP